MILCIQYAYAHDIMHKCCAYELVDINTLVLCVL